MTNRAKVLALPEADPIAAETALSLLRRFQAAEARLNTAEIEVTAARQERDEALSALRMYGKAWEQKR